MIMMVKQLLLIRAYDYYYLYILLFDHKTKIIWKITKRYNCLNVYSSGFIEAAGPVDINIFIFFIKLYKTSKKLCYNKLWFLLQTSSLTGHRWADTSTLGPYGEWLSVPQKAATTSVPNNYNSS